MNELYIIDKNISWRRTPILNSKDLAGIFKIKNPNRYEKALRIAELYIKWCVIFNINEILAFAQMCHETGYLTYTGDVPESANNFCGHGATGGDVYNIFKTEEEGILAHIAHLAWYIYPDHVNKYCNKVSDSRHFFGTKHNYDGSHTINCLNGRWAVPGRTYGNSIRKIANEILNIKFNQQEEKPEDDNDKEDETKFDLIIQMGHIGRTRGATGARNEQKFTKALGEILYKRIKKSNLKVRLMGADDWLKDKPNLCKCFFSIHYDGSLNQKAKGSSVGYPEYSNPIFAHKIHNIYTKLSKFPQRRDNYTNGLKNYYAWRKNYVVADYYCLLEHGFGSNKYEHDWMFSNIEKIADVHTKTIIEFLNQENNKCEKEIK